MAAHASDEMERLQKELTELKAKSAELADQFLRAKAEAENARRRAEDEVTKARKFGIESFAESMLPVADSLDAALAIQNATVQQLREGSDATLRQLQSALERNKVLAINPAAGEKFDPHQHQAISVVPAAQEPNTVVAVLQKGYVIADSMCGYRVYPVADTLAVIKSRPVGLFMDFDTEIMVRLYWRGLPVRFIRSRVIYPEGGRSNFRMWEDNVRISKMHARLFIESPLWWPARIRRLFRREPV